MSHYGAGNSGPRRNVWALGDRVIYIGQGVDRELRGRVAEATRDPVADETSRVWVRWDDGEAGYVDPNVLDVEG